MRYRLAILAIAMLVPMGALAAGEEQKCIDLGTSCDCSETLNTSPPHWAEVGCTWCINPTNSTGSKQCGSGGTWYIDANTLDSNVNPSTFWTFPAESGMPAGNTVSTVWKAGTSGSVGVIHGVGRADNVTSATRRVCQRFYIKFSGDFSTWPSCNNKMMEATWSGGQLQSSTSDGGGDIMLNAGGNFTQGNGNHHTSPNTLVPAAHCSSTWCGVEQCIAGNIQAGTNLSADFFVWSTDGARSGSTSFALGSSGSFGHLWNINPYREASGGACNGSRQYSHVMQASWTVDSEQRIGPAYEIEGGGGGGGGTTTLRSPWLLP